jgi:hypothetical protein
LSEVLPTRLADNNSSRERVRLENLSVARSVPMVENW